MTQSWLEGSMREQPALAPWPSEKHQSSSVDRDLTPAGRRDYSLGNYNLARILSRVAEGRARRRHSNRFANLANAGANSRPASFSGTVFGQVRSESGRVTPMGQIRWSTVSRRFGGRRQPSSSCPSSRASSRELPSGSGSRRMQKVLGNHPASGSRAGPVDLSPNRSAVIDITNDS
jgi:hypothetical protein